MFKTTYDRDPAELYCVPSGSRMKDEFQLVTEPDGNTHLEKVGVTDIYQQIQSYREGCTIDNIVRRAVNGDPLALAKHQGVFGDTRFDGQDLIQANEAIKQAQAVYKTLDPSIRAKYGSFDNFVKNFGTLDGIKDYLSNFNKPAADPAADSKGGVDNAEPTA